VLAALAPEPANRPTPAQLADELGPLLDRQPRGRLGGWKVALSAR
jgi:hypothetical protein